jgi:hypothetical protein
MYFMGGWWTCTSGEGGGHVLQGREVDMYFRGGRWTCTSVEGGGHVLQWRVVDMYFRGGRWTCTSGEGGGHVGTSGEGGGHVLQWRVVDMYFRAGWWTCTSGEGGGHVLQWRVTGVREGGVEGCSAPQALTPIPAPALAPQALSHPYKPPAASTCTKYPRTKYPRTDIISMTITFSEMGR